METLSRRLFLKQSASAALGFAGLRMISGCAAPGQALTGSMPYGYGAFEPDPAGIIDLPAGFSYRIISRAGETMTDGFVVPSRHDGMASFPGPNGLTVLVRNHEVGPGARAAEGAFGPGNELLPRAAEDRIYDAGSRGEPCLGGTTTLVYDTRRRALVSHHLSLAGTLVNCAGGPTPWNTWISCEEVTVRTGDRCARDHGFCFEVEASPGSGIVRPVPLKAMGRFKREAVAVEPVSGVVYQTEDLGNGLLYRFLPDRRGLLIEGGRLQALAVVEQSSLDTRNWNETTIAPGPTFRTRWIDLDDVESPDDDLRHRGFAAGAARFARAEGIWYGNETVYFACTNGGAARLGQIWKYSPSVYEGTSREVEQPGTIELFVEATEAGLIENCDNLTVAPWGDLIVCEDGSGSQFLVGITPDGEIYKLAENRLSDSELAGVTFSPDGTTLFVNIQQDGISLAITGPWSRRWISA